METVILKNGAEEAKPAVAVILLQLQRLFAEQPIHAYELTMKARNRDHVFFGGTGEDLAALRLVGPDGSMHDTVRNIILSAVEVDGFNIRLTSPVRVA